MRNLSADDLTPSQKALMDAAEKAAQTATCTYSGFAVGAAVRVITRNGSEVMVHGNNHETINFNSTCAEKHAVMRAYADHSWVDEDGKVVRPEITELAVYCTQGGTPQQPCGDCRQMLHEINPKIHVLAAAGPGENIHDQSITSTTVRGLLPHGFDAHGLHGDYAQEAPINDGDSIEEMIVHIPRPAFLKEDVEARTELLKGVHYILLVGSPKRARRIAELAHKDFGARYNVDEACYCDLTKPGRDESSREYAIYVNELPDGTRFASVSHGIGRAGVEIVLSEFPALLALVEGKDPEIRGVIRCGTRGTLTRVPLGCVALSTKCHDDHLAPIEPSEHWLNKLREAAGNHDMKVVPETVIDERGNDPWPEEGTSLLIEGHGMSASFFWKGQARPLYKPALKRSAERIKVEKFNRVQHLLGLINAGIRWIEMEDYTVLRMAAECGYPAASVGAVIAHRRRPDGTFQLDYDKDALLKSELIPAELALKAFSLDHAAHTK